MNRRKDYEEDYYGSDFGCPGYFRAAYCIKEDTIRRSLPAFKKLAAEYGK